MTFDFYDKDKNQLLDIDNNLCYDILNSNNIHVYNKIK